MILGTGFRQDGTASGGFAAGRRRPWSRAFAGLAALVVLLAGLTGCGGDQTGRRDGVVDADDRDPGVQPEQRFYDYRLIETEAGVKRWVLDSDEMLKYSGRQDVTLVTVHMDFFRGGDYYSTLVSDSGIANLKTNDVFVWGDVVVTTDDGRRLRTSELHYTNADGLIRNEVFNVFDRGDDVITGIGLEATPDLDYIEIKQDVAAEVGDEAAEEVAEPTPGPGPDGAP